MEKILIEEYCNDSNLLKYNNGSLRTVIIEKNGNGLKVQIKGVYLILGGNKILYPAGFSYLDSYYLNKNLSPLEYYLKVYSAPIIQGNYPLKNYSKYFKLMHYNPALPFNHTIDNGSGYIVLKPGDSFKDYNLKYSWKANYISEINSSEKVVIYVYCEDSGFLKNSNLERRNSTLIRAITIERSGNGLKVRTDSMYVFYELEGLLHPEVVSSANIYYNEKNLSPWTYYLEYFSKAAIIKDYKELEQYLKGNYELIVG